jgi:hypothetical protein
LRTISASVSQISYSKGGIKEKFRDIPWENLEYLSLLIDKLGGNELCDIVFPLIVKEDLPELLERLQQIQKLNKLLTVCNFFGFRRFLIFRTVVPQLPPHRVGV